MQQITNKTAALLLSVNQAEELTGLKERGIRKNCTSGKYPGAIKGADGWLIPLASLPQAAQDHYQNAQPKQEGTALAALSNVPTVHVVLDAEALHLAYRHAPPKSKARADKLFAAVDAFESLRKAGETKGSAYDGIKAEYGVNKVTLWRAREAVTGQPRELWTALLLPRYKGRAAESELTPEAWEWIKSHYLSTSEPSARVCIKEAKKQGRKLGWVFPSDKTIIRKLNALPAPIVLLGRKGKEAFDATFPAAERDFTTYALHDTWVSDGRKVDVFCRWPDGTVDRPFIVAWAELRTRMILGVRGGLNPSANLTLASFHSALINVNIKPEKGLIDNGREYAAKTVTGGQETRYRFKIKENDPIGAFTRMGIKAQWARPYRGQEKPIEKFWDYIADHLDKLPQFQGAYCGKDTVSKPEDFDRNKAIPIEVYTSKLAEILEEFNREHKHRGHGMGGKTPAQLYEELMQAEPQKVWARPSAEDMRLLCLEQRMLTLNNKDASIRFKLDGYGEVRYWCDELADLPLSARAKKYNVYLNPDNPDIPVLVYDGQSIICEASRIGMVGSKEAAKQHCINKAEFKKPRMEEFKEIKKNSPVALPAPPATTPGFIDNVIINSKPAPLTPPELPKLKELAPGVWQDPATGETIGKAKPVKQKKDADIEAIENLRRIKAQREAATLQKRFGTA